VFGIQTSREIGSFTLLRLRVCERDQDRALAGSKAAAVMHEVDAVVHRLAKAMLLAGDLSGIAERWPEIG
jgi:hypothetical protein